MNTIRSRSDQSSARIQGGDRFVRAEMLSALICSLIFSLPLTSAAAEKHEKNNHRRENSSLEN